MKKISIHTEYIKLDQFLKLAGITGSGGEAKEMIESGSILVNDEPEQRRGRKLRKNDKIKVGQELFMIEQAGV